MMASSLKEEKSIFKSFKIFYKTILKSSPKVLYAFTGRYSYVLLIFFKHKWEHHIDTQSTLKPQRKLLNQT